MRKKHIIACASLVTSFMLAVTAVSNAYALYTHKATDVEFNIGEQPKVGYYLVGSGSFVSGSEWSTAGGKQMYAHEGDRGMLKHQYLTAGDVFKITDGTSEGWYGWNENDDGTDTTNFKHTAYKKSDGLSYRLYFNCNELSSWWHRNDDNTYAYIYNSNSDKLSAWPGEKMTREPGTDYYYVDITATKSYSYVIFNSDTDGNQSEDLDMPNRIDADCYWAKNEWPSGGKFKVYTPGYADSNSKVFNDNIRVQTTGYYDIYLNNDGKIYITESAS